MISGLVSLTCALTKRGNPFLVKVQKTERDVIIAENIATVEYARSVGLDIGKKST